jgi:benzaldehyde dehydrogenase (NAD)
MNAPVKTECWSGKIFTGSWVAAQGGVAPVLEAATGAALGEIGVASPEDVDAAARSAQAAQKAWAATPFDQRAAIVREAARLLKERAAEFTLWNVRECGSIVPKGEWEVGITHEQMQQAAALAGLPNGMMFPSSVPGRTNLWQRVPLGVVGVIAPWNFPLFLAMRSVAPALALGNAVLLKPDLQSAVTGGALIARLFEDAGLPPGVLQVLPGGPATGDAVVRHPCVNMISFTGSTAVGRQIGEFCGRALKKVALELGGNNAMIVLDDADLDGASSCAAWGGFLHQGQICMAAGRHLVHRSVADAYAAKLVERAKKLYVGDPNAGPAHLGPLINDRQTERVHRIVTESIAAGATLLAGGTHEGRFYQPTVLSNVGVNMPAFAEEIFGPVAPITVFDTDEEAVALANSSEYGLAAAIHSRSTARALRMASQLKSGMVHINDQPVNCEPQVPFGGMGASGSGGRFGGPASIEEFTQAQWVSVSEKAAQYPF